jgi:hypothetical protein
VARDCDTELCATSAKEKAIAYLSTDIRPRCNSKASSDGIARAQRTTHAIPAECLAASDCRTHQQPLQGRSEPKSATVT